ncbi:MAG: hypothetical protein ABL966_01000 [Acidimicrobiales bacterium]
MQVDRRLASGLSLGAMAVGYVLVAVALFVDHHVLDAAVYQDALVEADAYERTYTEILVDPDVIDVTEELLGDLGLEWLPPADARVLATSTLRWVLPPSLIQQGSDRLITSSLAYVRGDVDRLEADVDLRPVADHLEDAVASYAMGALTAATDEVFDTLDEFRAGVADFAASIRAGRIPASVPVPGDELDPDAVAAVLDEVAAATGSDRLTVASLAAARSRDAVAAAITGALDVRVREATEHLNERLEDGRFFDPVLQVADRAERSRSTVVGTLNTARDLVAVFGAVALGLGLVLAILGTVGTVLLHRTDRRRLVSRLAAGAVAAGAVAGVVLLAAPRLLRPPLGPATTSGAGSWDLPLALRAVLLDVEGNISSTLSRAAFGYVVAPLVVGAVLGVAVVVSGWWRRFDVALAATTAAMAVAVGAVWIVAPASESSQACNGHVELCDRAYDEIVQAATHNSMSSPDVVRVWPEHDETIGEQLDRGIRALLVDTHYWTELTSPDQLATLSPDIPRPIIEATLARQDAALAGRPGAYLCHNHCIWGGAPIVEALEEITAFLDDNPRDVVTLIIQDAISTQDTVSAFEAAGLLRYVHTQVAGTDWPTLDELIDRGERLVVFAEASGPPPGWYHAAFEHIQDTPFRFESVDDLSCEPARGPDDATLFLMNHWLQAVAPDRRNAAIANTREVIVERARRCEAERGQLPDFIAVDFSGIGDVLGAVDELNGLP